MRKVYTILLGGLLIITSCSGSEDSDTTEGVEIERVDIEGLALNNGEKWSANTETIEGVHNMMKLVDNNFESNEDYQQLASDLGSEKSNIFDKCSMKGEAHDNLHSFLMPLIDKIDQLEESSEVDKSIEITNDIKIHLNEFDYFFE